MGRHARRSVVLGVRLTSPKTRRQRNQHALSGHQEAINDTHLAKDASPARRELRGGGAARRARLQRCGEQLWKGEQRRTELRAPAVRPRRRLTGGRRGGFEWRVGERRVGRALLSGGGELVERERVREGEAGQPVASLGRLEGMQPHAGGLGGTQAEYVEPAADSGRVGAVEGEQQAGQRDGGLRAPATRDGHSVLVKRMEERPVGGKAPEHARAAGEPRVDETGRHRRLVAPDCALQELRGELNLRRNQGGNQRPSEAQSGRQSATLREAIRGNQGGNQRPSERPSAAIREAISDPSPGPYA